MCILFCLDLLNKFNFTGWWRRVPQENKEGRFLPFWKPGTGCCRFRHVLTVWTANGNKTLSLSLSLPFVLQRPAGGGSTPLPPRLLFCRKFWFEMVQFSVSSSQFVVLVTGFSLLHVAGRGIELNLVGFYSDYPNLDLSSRLIISSNQSNNYDDNYNYQTCSYFLTGQ